LKMHEGKVVVTSPCLPSAKTASGSDVLEAACESPPLPAKSAASLPSEGSPTARASAGTSVADAAPPPPPMSNARTVTSIVPIPPGSAAASASEPPEPDWRALARQSKVGEAWAAVSSEGFDAVKGQSSSEDLLLLANLARLSGRVARAAEVYHDVRARYPGSESAAAAAFHLGRLSIHGNGANAERWFQTYLLERPNGFLAQEALGRILELQARGKNREAAESTARAYLQRYPSGPHAVLAQSILRP